MLILIFLFLNLVSINVHSATKLHIIKLTIKKHDKVIRNKINPMILSAENAESNKNSAKTEAKQKVKRKSDFQRMLFAEI